MAKTSLWWKITEHQHRGVQRRGWGGWWEPGGSLEEGATVVNDGQVDKAPYPPTQLGGTSL